MGSSDSKLNSRLCPTPSVATDRAIKARAARSSTEVLDPGDALPDHAILRIFEAVREAVAAGPSLLLAEESRRSFQAAVRAVGLFLLIN
jgi:hypothetical protein